MKTDISWLFNKQQEFLTPLQRLYPAFTLWWVSSAATPKTLSLDILEFSKFLGARTEYTQTDKSLKRLMVWTLPGLEILQTHNYEPCITPHVLPARNTTAPIQEVVGLHLLDLHHLFFPSPHTRSSTRTSPSSHCCAETSPLPAGTKMCWHNRTAQGYIFPSAAKGEMQNHQ